MIVFKHELDECLKIGSHYTCQNKRLTRMTLNSCLGHAHPGQKEEILSRCYTQVRPLNGLLLEEYDSSRVVITTTMTIPILIACSGDRPTIMKLTKGSWFYNIELSLFHRRLFVFSVNQYHDRGSGLFRVLG